MPAPAVKPGKVKKNDKGPLLVSLAETIRTGQAPQGADGGLQSAPKGRKVAAALSVWSIALAGEDDREEVFKAGLAPILQALLDKGDAEERHAAMGCLSVLALSEKHVAEVINSKVINAAAAILTSDHARGKLPAVQFIRQCAGRPEYASRVGEAALPGLIQILRSDGSPGWGQMRQAQAVAAQAVKLLIENVEGEPAELKHARRVQAVAAGAVPALARMVAYAPRMPPPAQLPAPPPVIGKKKGAGGKKAAKGPNETPLGSKDAGATVAAACLRFLSLVPDFMDHFIRSDVLADYVAALLSCGAEQACYVTGVLWEATAERQVAAAVQAAGGVPALLHCISRNLISCKLQGKSRSAAKAKDGKAAAKDPKAKGKGDRGDAAPSEPPCYPDMAVCNAAGALQHLTFNDDAKQQVVSSGGVAILTACLRLANPQTYENVVGALWNVGLDVRNNLALMAAGAPDFLAKPVPDSWLTRGSSSGAAAADAAVPYGGQQHAVRDRVFLTQQPLVDM